MITVTITWVGEGENHSQSCPNLLCKMPSFQQYKMYIFKKENGTHVNEK